MPDKADLIVVFDSNCVLCSAAVKFLLKHDAKGRVHFASSRKPVGQGLAAKHGFSLEDLDLTYLVVREDEVLTRSEATLALIAELTWPWRLLQILRIVPRTVRDAVYTVIARNRLRWFGEKQDCLVPTPEQRKRFLDSMPV